MPAGKYSFYLHTDDRTDMLAAGTLETISQPLRGDFLRTAAAAGSVLYHADNRLPALVTELFDGRLRYGQLASLLAALSGEYQTGAAPEPEGLPAVTGSPADCSGNAARRRFTLQLTDSQESRRVADLLEGTTSRQRGVLLRNLIIAGFALHTLDARLPRLLTSMPVPPDSIPALRALTGQIAGVTAPAQDTRSEPVQSAGRADVSDAQPAAPPSAVRDNMKKLF